MAMRAAIRNEGQRAEHRFIEFVPKARTSDQGKLGDAVMTVDGDTAYVEIKECHAEIGKGGTINQVRAIKYICCVTWAPKHRCWYVISPDQPVRLAATKNRGQHTEIPFECMNFSLKGLPDYLHTRCNDEQLAKTVEEAIRRGRKNARLHNAMCRLLEDIKSIKQRYHEEVRNWRQISPHTSLIFQRSTLAFD